MRSLACWKESYNTENTSVIGWRYDKRFQFLVDCDLMIIKSRICMHGHFFCRKQRYLRGPCIPLNTVGTWSRVPTFPSKAMEGPSVQWAFRPWEKQSMGSYRILDRATHSKIIWRMWIKMCTPPPFIMTAEKKTVDSFKFVFTVSFERDQLLLLLRLT